MKIQSKIFSLVIAAFFCTSRAALAVSGNAGGHGGDYIQALMETGAYDRIIKQDSFSEEAQSRLRADFFRSGASALWAIFILLEEGYQFHHKDGSVVPLTVDDIFDALNALKKATSEPGMLRMKSSLTLNGNVVTALNYTDGHVELNVPRWNEIATLYAPGFSEKVKGMVAAHEALSLLGRGIESTGIYSVSGSVIDFEQNYLTALGNAPIKITPVYPKMFNGKLVKTAKEATLFLTRNDTMGSLLMSSNWEPITTSRYDLYERDATGESLLDVNLAIYAFVDAQIRRAEKNMIQKPASPKAVFLRKFRLSRLVHDWRFMDGNAFISSMYKYENGGRTMDRSYWQWRTIWYDTYVPKDHWDKRSESNSDGKLIWGVHHREFDEYDPNNNRDDYNIKADFMGAWNLCPETLFEGLESL